MGSIFFILLLGLTYSVNCKRVPRQSAFSDDTCTTPDGVSGLCVKLRQCQSLLDLHKRSKTTPGAADFLKRSVCRYDNSDAVVCCPQQSDQERWSSARPTIPTVSTGGERDEFPQLPSPPYCATSSGGRRIVSGEPASLGEFPWMAALGYRSTRRPTIQWLCGGSLITSKHVITAAHCLQHPTLTLTKVRVGDLDLDESARDGANPIDVNVKRTIPHPQYNANNKFDDIALIILEREVPISRNVQPICLPKVPELRKMNFVGKFLIISGWGDTAFKGKSSSVLQKAQIPVVTNDDCNRAYNKKGASIIDTQLCAGRDGKDACQGDSGGPLMVPYGPDAQNRSYYLIGVVSYGFRCAEPNYPGIYSKVASYLSWISQNIN